jgi:hypothetical protein
VATSHSTWKFSQGWVSAAFALFIVDVGVLHGLIKRSQREYFALAERLATSSATDTGDAAVATRRAEAAQLTGIEKRISLGWGVFNLIVVVVVVLMVFRPGA